MKKQKRIKLTSWEFTHIGIALRDQISFHHRHYLSFPNAPHFFSMGAQAVRHLKSAESKIEKIWLDSQ